MDLESVRVVVVEKMTLCNLSLVLAVPCLEILRKKPEEKDASQEQ